jgi:hypothetical protein
VSSSKGDKNILSPNKEVHSVLLKSGRVAALIVANQSSNTTFHCCLMDPVSGFRANGEFIA